jgi:hypothetical protein
MAQLCDLFVNLAQSVPDADISLSPGVNGGPVITIAPRPGLQPPKLNFKVNPFRALSALARRSYFARFYGAQLCAEASS